MLQELPLTTILRTQYNIENPTILQMEGYVSLNFKVTTSNQDYVLKVYGKSPDIHEMIAAENRILCALKEQEVSFSKVIRTNTGAIEYSSHAYTYRLLSFLPGSFLAEIDHSPLLLKSFGSSLAKMTTVLTTLRSPVIEAKVTQWDLKHFQKNWKYLETIPTASDRSLVDYFCLQFNQHVLPLQYELRQGIIHNDANDWNVLVGNDKVTGIIDFGDVCHSWVINELAVGLTYVLMEKKKPLTIAKQVIGAYHEIFPLKELELSVLYYLIAGRLCMSVLNSAHAKRLKPDSDYITVSEKFAWNLLRKWVSINPIKAHNTFREACGFSTLVGKSMEAQLYRRGTNLSDSLSLSYTRPIEMVGAAFQYMYDAEGNTFLDAYNNIIQVGHCHPTVVRAGQRTMAKLNTNTRYIYDELLSYTDALLAKFPAHLNKVFLVNSGSAASDLAIRIARTHTTKKKIMVMEHGYHGNTQNGIDISHYKYHHKGGTGKQTNIVEAQLPKVFGSRIKTEEVVANHYIELTKERISENIGEIAAFISEPIVGCGGQVPLPRPYLKRIYKEIRAQGGVCISDEVQVGFGRLGDYFWGYEMYDVVPDIIVLGKPIANGHPMGAVVTTQELADSFDNGMEFFSSFGGNPVSCAIGEAVLNVLEEENLPKQAKEVGAYFVAGLKLVQQEHPELADIRGEGLFLGVEILDVKGRPNTELASYIKNALRERYILISTDGPYDNVLKIKPPLYFNRKNVDHFLQELNRVLKNRKKINTFSSNNENL